MDTKEDNVCKVSSPDDMRSYGGEAFEMVLDAFGVHVWLFLIIGLEKAFSLFSLCFDTKETHDPSCFVVRPRECPSETTMSVERMLCVDRSECLGGLLISCFHGAHIVERRASNAKQVSKEGFVEQTNSRMLLIAFFDHVTNQNALPQIFFWLSQPQRSELL
jgi:hypothetical protein